MTDRPKGQHETDKRFPSGIWAGYWIQGYIKGRMRLNLEFIDGSITGEGTDPVGKFIIQGVYSTVQNVVIMGKQYQGAHYVGYCGRAADGGLIGTWQIPKVPQIDEWKIWPIEQEEFEIVHLAIETEDGPVVLIGEVEIENIEEEFNAK